MSRMMPTKRGGSSPMAPADREIAGKDAAVLAPRTHFASDADDAGFAGLVVTVQVPVVLGVVGRGHQHVDVAPDDLVAAVAEDRARRRG